MTISFLRRSPNLVILCFFIYKTTESLLQSANRIHLYTTVCSAVVGNTSEQNLCDLTKETTRLNVTLTKLKDASTSNATSSIQGEQILFDEVLIQRLSGAFLIAYRVLLNLLATITCLILGSFSNKIGRKIIMLIPCVGAVIACGWFGCGFIPNLNPIPDIILFILTGAVTYGICGKSSAMTMGANSYIADVSGTKDRTKLLGRLLGMNFFGLCIGSGLLAIFSRYSNIQGVLIFSACSNVVLIFVLTVFVSDSQDTSTQPILDASPTSNGTLAQQDPTVARRSEPHKDTGSCCVAFIENMRYSYRFLFKKQSGSSRIVYLILFGSILFNQMVKSGEQDAILLFVTNKPFRWTAEIYGYYLTVYYGCMAFLLTIILPIIERHLAPKDTTLIVIGMSCKIARLLTMGLSKSGIVLFIAAVAGSSAGFISSGTRSLISKVVRRDDVGASFALVSCLETLANLFGGTLFTGIYNLTITFYPGTVFLIDSFLHVLMLCAFLWLRCKVDWLEQSPSIKIDEPMS